TIKQRKTIKKSNKKNMKISSTIVTTQIKQNSNICDNAVKATAPCTNATTIVSKNSNAICLLITRLISRLVKPILLIAANFSRSSSKSVYNRKYKKLPADTKKTIPINNPTNITGLQTL